MRDISHDYQRTNSAMFEKGKIKVIEPLVTFKTGQSIFFSQPV